MPNDQLVQLIMTMFKEKDIAWWSAEDFRKMLEGGIPQAAHFKPLVEAKEVAFSNTIGMLATGIVLLTLIILVWVKDRYMTKAKVLITFSMILSFFGLGFFHYQRYTGLQFSEKQLVTSVALQPTNLKTMVRNTGEWKKITLDMKANFSSKDVYPGPDLINLLSNKEIADMVHDQVTTLKWIELTFKYKDNDLIFKHRKLDDEGKKLIEEKVKDTVKRNSNTLGHVERILATLSMIAIVYMTFLLKDSISLRKLMLIVVIQAVFTGLLMTASIYSRAIIIPKSYQEVYDFTTEELLKVEKPLETE